MRAKPGIVTVYILGTGRNLLPLPAGLYVYTAATMTHAITAKTSEANNTFRMAP
jgi:hypothetical protein